MLKNPFRLAMNVSTSSKPSNSKICRKTSIFTMRAPPRLIARRNATYRGIFPTPAILANLRGDVHNDFMESGDAGEPTPVFFEFLDFAFAVSRANDEPVIVGAIRLPIVTPQGPG